MERTAAKLPLRSGCSRQEADVHISLFIKFPLAAGTGVAPWALSPELG